MFGKLSSFGLEDLKELYREQVHSNCISIILHMNEHDVEVRKTCLNLLQEIGPFFEREKVVNVLNEHSKNMQYDDFIDDFSKIFVIIKSLFELYYY